MEIILDAFTICVSVYVVTSSVVLFLSLSYAEKSNKRLINESLEIRLLLEGIMRRKLEAQTTSLADEIQPINSARKSNNLARLNEFFKRPTRVIDNE